jgi:hypothetical protein
MGVSVLAMLQRGTKAGSGGRSEISAAINYEALWKHLF